MYNFYSLRIELNKWLIHNFSKVAVLGSILVVISVGLFADPYLAMKSSFVVTSAFLFLFLRNYRSSVDRVNKLFNNGHYIKLNLAFFFIFVAYISLNRANTITFAAFLLVISFIMSLHIVTKPSRKEVLFHSIIITAISMVFIFLTTGIYVGNVDPIWQHYPNVKYLLNSGEISAVTERYQPYPILYLLTATTGLFTNTTPYHSSIIILLSFGILFPIFTYLLFEYGVKTNHSKFSPLFIPGLSVVFHHLLIFFPQTFATLLVIVIIYAVCKKSRIVPILVSICLIATHHLTIILMTVFLAPITRLVNRRQLVLVLSVITGTISYWVFIGEKFVVELISIIPTFLLALVGMSGNQSSQPGFLRLGAIRPENILLDSILYPFSPQGIYYTALSTLLIIGIYYKINDRDWGHILLLGLISALFLPLPISFVGKSRIAFAASFLFIAFLSFSVDKSIGVEKNEVVTIILITSLVSFGPLVGAGYNPIYEDYSSRSHEFQRSVPSGTLSELTEAAEFSSSTQSTLTTFRVSSYTVNFKGGNSDNDLLVRDGSVISPEGLFLYRMDWVDYRASIYSPFQSTTVLYSEDHLQRTISSSNKIYSSGGVGITWSNESQKV